MDIEEHKGDSSQPKNKLKLLDYDQIVQQEVSKEPWIGLLGDKNSDISKLVQGAANAFSKWQKPMLQALEVLEGKNSQITLANLFD